MPLLYFAMMVSVLAGRSIATPWLHLPPGQGVLSASAIVLMVGGIAKIFMAYAAVVFQETRNGKRSFQLAHSFRNAFLWIWTLCSPLLLAGTGWGSTVHALAMGYPSMALEVILWALPTFFVVLLVELAFFHWEDYCRLACLTPESLKDASFTLRFSQFFWNQAKHSWLMVAAPTLIICLALDLSGLHGSTSLSNVPSWMVYGSATAVLLLIMPDLMVQLWGARALPNDPKCGMLKTFWRKLGGNPSSLRTWSTQMRAINAVVIGIVPWRRKVLLSDLLLQQLSLEQTELIFCHEAAHIRRHHFLIRSLPWLASLGIAFALVPSEWVRAMAAEVSPALIYGLAAIKLLLILWIASRIARWTEFDADRQAIQLAVALRMEGEACPVERENQRSRAIEDLSSALLATTPASHRNKKSWMHPSVTERIHLLIKNEAPL